MKNEVDKKSESVSKSKKVDVVIVDNSKLLVDTLGWAFEKDGKVTARYYCPLQLLEEVSKYDKETHFLMDYGLKSVINGIELAEKLYDKGYTKLYMMDDECLGKIDPPYYLTVISKMDIDAIFNIVGL